MNSECSFRDRKEIIERRLMWGHAWRKQGSLIRQIMEEDHRVYRGKRPLGRPKLRREDCVKKDIKTIGP